MKKSSIQINSHYEIQLGKNTSKVKVASFDESHGTWLCETDSGKTLRVKDAARFLKEIKPKEQRKGGVLRQAAARLGLFGRSQKCATTNVDCPEETGIQVPAAARGPKPLGEMSVLDAAHKVLLEEGRPMKVGEIMETALARKYCKVGGKTPFNTFNGGIRSEIAKKGKASRFVWVDKGQFAAR
jgi:hypothetical protein